MYWKSEESEIYFNEVMSKTFREPRPFRTPASWKNRTWKFMVQILNQQQILEEYDDL